MFAIHIPKLSRGPLQREEVVLHDVEFDVHLGPGPFRYRASMDIRVAADDDCETLLFRAWCQAVRASPTWIENQGFGPSCWETWSFPRQQELKREDGVSYRIGLPGTFSSSLLELQLGNQDRADLRCVEISTRKPSKREITELTRMEAAKSLFTAFANRSIAYNYPTAVGLIPFDSEVHVENCDITLSYEDFIEDVENLQAGGDTKLFDAIHEAGQKLLEWKQRTVSRRKEREQKEGDAARLLAAGGEKSPKKARRSAPAAADDPLLRIICFSDGRDCESEEHRAWECAELLQTNKIVLDLVRIDAEHEEDPQAHAVAKASGGYKY